MQQFTAAVDGTLGAATNVIPNEFGAAAVSPVTGFPYRVVSASLKILSVNPVTT